MGGSEFDYSDEYDDDGKPAQVVDNQPHDEEVALASDGDDSPMGSPGGDGFGGGGGDDDGDVMRGTMNHGGDSPPEHADKDDGASEGDDDEAHLRVAPRKGDSFGGTVDSGNSGGGMGGGGGGEGEGGGGEGGGGGGGSNEPTVAARPYNPEDYADLQVSDEVRELFQYIGRYKPHDTVLNTKVKPFIPDYIPAIGDIDEFIKVPRPDGKPDDLGLKVLDEPASKQTDATVLQLQLRHASKQSNMPKLEVKALEKAENDPSKLNSWIENVKSLHKGASVANINYSKNMPDIETLMAEWDPDVEDVLRDIRLPDETLPVDLKQQGKLMCAVLDIPVYNNLVESLHVMFTTYLEFKNNPFLQQQQRQNGG